MTWVSFCKTATHRNFRFINIPLHCRNITKDPFRDSESHSFSITCHCVQSGIWLNHHFNEDIEPGTLSPINPPCLLPRIQSSGLRREALARRFLLDILCIYWDPKFLAGSRISSVIKWNWLICSGSEFYLKGPDF